MQRLYLLRAGSLLPGLFLLQPGCSDDQLPPPAAGTGSASGSGASPQLGTGAALATGGASNDGGMPNGGSSSGGTAAGGSAAASNGGGGTPLAPLALEGLSIELNPDMPLGAYVSWTTPEAAHSEVEWTVEGTKLHIVDDTPTTDHRLYVVGMRPETTYTLTARSRSEGAEGSDSGDVTTGSLPTFLPPSATVITEATTDTAPGFTLTNFWDSGQSPATAVILDPGGYPVWFFESGPGNDQFGATSTQWTHDGTVVIGPTGSTPAREIDLEGQVLWEGPTGGDGALSHDTVKLLSGNYLLVRESASTARIDEVDSANTLVWSWDLYRDSDVTNDGVNDWCHMNSVSTNADETSIFLNCRFQGLFKVDKATDQLVWQMGAAMDSDQTGDVTYLPDNSARFNDAHDPEVHEDGTVLFYDNQGWSNRMVGDGNGTYESQVVEYQLNEGDKEATLIWSFPGDFTPEAWYTQNWSTPIWGDADRLENDNILVTAGITGTPTGGMTPDGTNTRIFEVTRSGEIVWAIEWPPEKGAYRAERIHLPARPAP